MKCLRARLLVVTISAAITTFPNFSSAQSEKEIVAKFRTALRKCASDDPEPSMISTGSVKVSKMEFGATMYYDKPNVLMELTMQNVKFITFQNDSLHWEYDGVNDQYKLTRLSREESEKENLRSKEMDFATKDLLHYKERNHKLKYSGTRKLDSLEVYALELTKPDKSKIQYYLHTKTNLIYKISSAAGYRIFANYRVVNNDYVYPTYMGTQIDNAVEMEMFLKEITINAVIPDSIFRIPQEAFGAEEKLRKMQESQTSLADSLYYAGDFEKALAEYSRAIAGGGKNYGAYNGRGLAKIQLKKYYEAIGDFTLALEIEPQGSRALNNRGLAKFYLKDHAGAVDDYTQAIEIDTAFVTAYKNRGLSYIHTSKFSEAAEDFLKATQLKPDDGEAHFKYGVSIAQLERYDEAILSYREGLRLGHRTAEAYNYKGVSEYKLAIFDSATVDFKTALDLDNQNLQYIENYGNGLYSTEHYDRAKEQFEKYLKVKSDNPSIHNMIGLCKYQEEDYKGAIKDFTKCIELNPKGPVYFDNRAAAKENLEDYDGAIADYTESIALYPNDANVFYKRGLIKIHTSKKIEGCLDLGTANEMKLEEAKEAILKHCN